MYGCYKLRKFLDLVDYLYILKKFGFKKPNIYKKENK